MCINAFRCFCKEQVESTGRHFEKYILSELDLKTQNLPHRIFTDFSLKTIKQLFIFTIIIAA